MNLPLSRLCTRLNRKRATEKRRMDAMRYLHDDWTGFVFSRLDRHYKIVQQAHSDGYWWAEPVDGPGRVELLTREELLHHLARQLLERLMRADGSSDTA